MSRGPCSRSLFRVFAFTVAFVWLGAAATAGPLDDERQLRERRVPTPPAVKAELLHADDTFTELPELTALPAFVERARVLNLLAAAGIEHDEDEPLPLDGRFLDAPKTLFLIATGGPVEGGVLALFHAERGFVGALTHAGYRRVLTADVLGDATLEVIVEADRSNMLSVWSLVWTVLYAGEDGLEPLATLPRSLQSHPKRLAYCFVNRVDFPERRAIRTTAVYLAPGCVWVDEGDDDGPRLASYHSLEDIAGAPREAGETHRFGFDGSRQLTADTRAGAELLATSALLQRWLLAPMSEEESEPERDAIWVFGERVRLWSPLGEEIVVRTWRDDPSLGAPDSDDEPRPVDLGDGRMLLTPETDDLIQGIDSVVLHARPAPSLDVAVARVRAAGKSCHFYVASDGEIVQTLPAATLASHVDEAVDLRSVCVTLVPEEVHGDPAAGGEGNAFALHYPPVQLRRLASLLRALSARLGIPWCGLPRPDVDARPRPGVWGHLHFDPKAWDPGPTFPWDALATALGQPAGPPTPPSPGRGAPPLPRD